MIKDTDLAWLAGIIDGEGSIMFFDKRKLDKKLGRDFGWIQTSISVTSCDELMIKRISEIFYELEIPFHFVTQKNNSRNKKWNTALKIATTGLNSCKKVLNIIKPYLVTKKYLAEFLLKYIEWRQDKGFGYSRKSIGPDEIQRWFYLYDIVRLPKYPSSTTKRKASKPLELG